MRRQFVTHPKFQLSFTVSFAVGCFLIFFFIGGSTILSLILLSRDPLLTESQRIVLKASTGELGGYLTVLGGVSLLVFSALGFFLSYKFVGPLFRLESWLQDIIEEKTADPIKLRPGDELEPVAEALNRELENKLSKKGGV